MSHINSIEAVWNQSKGMVLVLIEAEGLSIQLQLPPDNAEQLAGAILAANRIPERASALASRCGIACDEALGCVCEQGLGDARNGTDAESYSQ